MRYLTFGEAISLHRAVVSQSGGVQGLRDPAALDSALAQPGAAFGDRDLYSTVEDKAEARCFSLAQNHPFVDGNKRLAHAAMETFLLLNDSEIVASVDEQERLMLNLASGKVSRAQLAEWLSSHTRRLS